VCAWFLASKLIAGKGSNFQTLLAILVGELGKLGIGIVDFGETSLAGYIDQEDDTALVGGHGKV